jgi:hypothetical protein
MKSLGEAIVQVEKNSIHPLSSKKQQGLTASSFNLCKLFGYWRDLKKLLELSKSEELPDETKNFISQRGLGKFKLIIEMSPLKEIKLILRVQPENLGKRRLVLKTMV